MTEEQKALIARFASLFPGYSKAHGRYDVKPNTGDPTGKQGGKAWTAPGPVTPEIWKEHLDGSGPGLGVIMLLDDDTCMFGVIDVDDRTTDHGKMEAQIKKLGLPLVLCRSKSGGAHLYVFLKEPAPASLLQTRLSEWTAALGLSAKTEQFPKQSSRAGEEDQGNWINIPYQHAARTMRYGFLNGQPLKLAGFLDHAEASRVTLEKLQEPLFHILQDNDLFYEGPPCLVTLHRQGGLPEGTRNDGMLSVGVYIRKRYPEDWRDRLDEYNSAMCTTPLPEEEMKDLAKSLSKKDYTYKCKASPLNSVCQRRVCLSRNYGIGDTSVTTGLLEFLGVTRYEYQPPDPPMWAFEIMGKRVMVDNDTMYSRDALNRAIMAQANCVPLHLPPARWLRHLNTMIGTADVVPMPEDAGPTGQLWERVQMFLEQGVNALTKEELLSGKIWRHNGQAHFRGVDLFDYLESRRIKFKSESVVWTLLKENGAKKDSMKVAGKVVNVWFIPYTVNPEAPKQHDRQTLPTGQEF